MIACKGKVFRTGKLSCIIDEGVVYGVSLENDILVIFNLKSGILVYTIINPEIIKLLIVIHLNIDM